MHTLAEKQYEIKLGLESYSATLLSRRLELIYVLHTSIYVVGKSMAIRHNCRKIFLKKRPWYEVLVWVTSEAADVSERRTTGL